MKIGFIGVGHMAGSILTAISKNKDYMFYINDIDKNKTTNFKKLLTERVLVSNTYEVVKASDFIFLGVKPKDLKFVLEQIKNISNNKVFISMAAGFNICEIINITGNINLIRIMPNTPVAVGKGVTFYINYNVDENSLNKFKTMMMHTGSLYEIEENKMDVVSVLTGSSPAYLDYFLDALSDFGVSHGFTKEEATEYVLKMAEGVATLNLKSNKSLKTLGDEVCSPGGSTIEGVKILLDNELYNLVGDAAKASYNKNKNMK